MFVVETESPTDHELIEPLLDAVFGEQRTRKISYRYREAVSPIGALSLVARDGDTLVGSIRYWPVLLEEHTALLLGPLAIARDRQRQGIGRALASQSLDLAERMGYRTVFLVGEPDYYRHLGFIPAPETVIMPGEDPNRLQYRILHEDGSPPLQGVIRPWQSHTERPADQDQHRASLRLVG